MKRESEQLPTKLKNSVIMVSLVKYSIYIHKQPHHVLGYRVSEAIFGEFHYCLYVEYKSSLLESRDSMS